MGRPRPRCVAISREPLSLIHIFIKSLAIDEAYGIGQNGEIFDVTLGLDAAEELTAADGKTIPADGLIEVISLDESGHGKAISDLPMGSYYELLFPSTL